MSLARKHTGFSFFVNLGGRIWIAIFSILFIPKFGALLGPEAYGLAALQQVIMAISVFLDLGLSAGITHRLALFDSNQSEERTKARNLLRSFEALYFFISFCLALAVFFGAPFAARTWFHLETLPEDYVNRGIQIIAFYILFQFPQALYAGALTGLYKPDRLNLVRGLQVATQNLGAYLLLSYYSPSVHVFLFWFAFISLFSLIWIRHAAWKELPGTGLLPARIDSALLKENFTYFKGLTVFSFWGVVVANADRLIVSKFLPLTQFGFYQFAYSLASALQFLAQPFQASISPKLSRLFQQRDQEAAERFYLRASSMLSTLIIPAGISIAIFSKQVLVVAGASDEFIVHAAPVLSVLSIGTMMNALMIPPLALQISNEWMVLSTYKNILAAFLYLPLLYAAVRFYETIGVAYCWVALNAAYILFEIPLMHRRIFPSKLFAWYRRCLVYPVFTTLLVLLPIKFWLGDKAFSRWEMALFLCLMGGVTLLIVAFSQGENRTIVKDNLKKIPSIAGELKNRRKL